MKNELPLFHLSFVRRLFVFGVLIVALAGTAFAPGCRASGDYYGTREQVRTDNVSGRLGFAGAGKNVPAITETVAGNSRWLCIAGAVAVVAGGICFFRRELAEFGTGLLAAGGGLCALAFVLPLYAGWFALGICCALLAWFFPPVYSRIAALFKKPITQTELPL